MNIMKELRLKHRLTQQQLAELAGITRMAVLRNEQGLYTTPSPKLVELLLKLENLDSPNSLVQVPEDIIDLYEMDQTTQRQKAATFLKPFDTNKYATVVNLSHFKAMHPLEWYRSEIPLSEIGFAIAFCIHQSTLFTWEHQLNPNVPAQIRLAFEQAGKTDVLHDIVAAIEHVMEVRKDDGATKFQG